MPRSGLIPSLPRQVWLYELGVVVNNVGNGMMAPFTVIYLHNARHFSLGVSGSVYAVFAAMSFVGSFAGGALSDRFGAKRALILSLSLQAAGLAAFAFVGRPWQAFLALGLAGLGNGGFIPGQSSLLAAVVDESSRQAAFSVQRMADNLGLGVGGALGGLIAVSSRPGTFTLLFLLDALTVLIFAALITALVRRPLEPARRPEGAQGYRAVLRERLILKVVSLNLVYVLAGYVVLETVLPVVIKNGTTLSERAVGLVYLLNTFTVAVTQLPLLKLFAGRRRMRILVGMCLLWAVTWLGLALVVHSGPSAAVTLTAFALAAALFAVGEGAFSVQNAMLADLAPEHVRGRVMALVPASFTIGFTIGASAAGFALERSYTVVFLVAAALLLLASLRVAGLERQLPEDKRRVPRPKAEQELEQELEQEAEEGLEAAALSGAEAKADSAG